VPHYFFEIVDEIKCNITLFWFYVVFSGYQILSFPQIKSISIDDIYMALQHYEEHLQATKAESRGVVCNAPTLTDLQSIKTGSQPRIQGSQNVFAKNAMTGLEIVKMKRVND